MKKHRLVLTAEERAETSSVMFTPRFAVPGPVLAAAVTQGLDLAL